LRIARGRDSCRPSRHVAAAAAALAGWTAVRSTVSRTMQCSAVQCSAVRRGDGETGRGGGRRRRISQGKDCWSGRVVAATGCCLQSASTAQWSFQFKWQNTRTWVPCDIITAEPGQGGWSLDGWMDGWKLLSSRVCLPLPSSPLNRNCWSSWSSRQRHHQKCLGQSDS